MKFKIHLVTLVFITNVFLLVGQNNDTLKFSDAKHLYSNKEYEKSLRIFIALCKQYDSIGDYKMLGKSQKYKGLIFKKNSDLTNARIHYKSALKNSLKAQDTSTALSIYNNLASLNYQEKQFDSCIYYFKKVTKFKNHEEKATNAHKNLIAIYTRTNKIDLAFKHADTTLEFYSTKKDSQSTSQIYNNIGSIHYKLNNFKKAKLFYEKSYKYLNSNSTIEEKKSILSNLMRTSFLTKDFDEARRLDTIRENLIDKVYKESYNEKITAIEAKYNQDKARQEEALNTEIERKKREKVQVWFAIFSIVGTSLLLIGFVSYRNVKLKTNNLSLNLIKKDLEKQNEIQLLQQQTQNKVINATLDGRENERKEIAQILHDSVSALLSSANLHLQVAKRKQNTESEEINKTQLIINEAADKVRDLSHKLISAILLKFGLEYATNDLCEKYSNSELEFELECYDKIPRFNQNLEIKLFSIIEEFCNNIMKHSKASIATIKLEYADNTLNIDIEDNGIGFDTSLIKKSNKIGVGLSQIKARIENLNGQLDIESQKNIGTQISIRVPIHSN